MVTSSGNKLWNLQWTSFFFAWWYIRHFRVCIPPRHVGWWADFRMDMLKSLMAVKLQRNLRRIHSHFQSLTKPRGSGSIVIPCSLEKPPPKGSPHGLCAPWIYHTPHRWGFPQPYRRISGAPSVSRRCSPFLLPPSPPGGWASWQFGPHLPAAGWAWGSVAERFLYSEGRTHLCLRPPSSGSGRHNRSCAHILWWSPDPWNTPGRWNT